MEPALLFDFAGRATTGVLGVLFGGTTAWLIEKWKRRRERRNILNGDARDSVVIEHHIVQTSIGPNGEKRPSVLRMRSLGQSHVDRVVPNKYLAVELLRRACKAAPPHTLISMEGAEGSFLLETLTNFVCDRVKGGGFEHDHYVMAPCCEPTGQSVHQPIVVVLIAVVDLALFEDWSDASAVQVEHGSDGMRVMTLFELANRFRAERHQLASLRAAGKSTMHKETIYLLDLALDKRSADVPVRPVPWSRFSELLRSMDLEGSVQVTRPAQRAREAALEESLALV